jgi:hypothetical protein
MIPNRIASLGLCLAAGLAYAQGGEVITVDTASATVDFGGAQRLADLPGPDGRVSLEEAGLASDNSPGVQTIGFAVPQSEWEFQWLFPGRVVLRPFLGFRTFDTVIIDGTTQTAFTGDTNPDGGEVVIWAATYLVDNVGSLVRGLDNAQLSISGGSGNTVQGNTESGIEVYDSTGCLIGGANPGEGNTGGTIKIDRASHNIIVGNTIQRVRILGWVDGGQPAVGNRVGGPTPGERNYITGYGTWNGEGAPGGTTVQIFDSVGTIVEGNWIGTTPDGMEQGHLASTAGVGFEGENHDAVIRNNRIAGILGHGQGPHYAGYLFGSAITLGGEGANFTIQGNTIGLNALGEPVLGSLTGISTADYYLGLVGGILIGGAGPGEGNEIAGHRFNGITVVSPLTAIRISGNSIHDNDDLGIDLVDPGFNYGVTANDQLDLDAGGNGLQNYPVLSEAEATGSSVHLVGALDSSPDGSFTVEFFASAACDGTGFGEGEVFLGTASVSTDGQGHAVFDVTLPAAIPGGWYATATATREATRDTSEFGPCAPIVGGGCVADFNGDGLANTLDVLAFLNAWGSGDPRGDFNGDGSINTLDVLAFLNAWSAGC